MPKKNRVTGVFLIRSYLRYQYPYLSNFILINARPCFVRKSDMPPDLILGHMAMGDDKLRTAPKL